MTFVQFISSVSLRQAAPTKILIKRQLWHRQYLNQLAVVVTLYMLAGALGMMLGGFWVAHPGGRQLERNIARALAAAMGLLLLATVPGVQKAVLSPAGHMLHHDQPEALARALDSFLDAA